MATTHSCDRCGRQVRERADLWEVSMRPVEKRQMLDDRRHRAWELCDRCRKHIAVELDEDR